MEKNIVERAQINVPHNTEILAYELLQTQTYYTENNEQVSELAVVLYKDGSLNAYSTQSGHLLKSFDLKAHLSSASLVDDFAYLKSITGTDSPLALLTKSGDLHRLSFTLKPLNVTRDRRQKDVNLIPKSLELTSISISIPEILNSTAIPDSYEEVDYYGSATQGIYIIRTSIPSYVLVKRIPSIKKAGEYSHTFISQGILTPTFSSVPMTARQGAVMMFADQSKIGFMRVYDGEVAKATCDVGIGKIVALEPDLRTSGKFYVGLEGGQILVMHIESSDRTVIGCEVEGKLGGENQASSVYELRNINSILLQYSPEAPSMTIYNLTFPTPEVATVALPSSAIVSPRLQFNEYGCLLLFSSQAHLYLTAIIDPVARPQSFAHTIVDNKIILFGIIIVIVMGYRLCSNSISNRSKERYEEMYGKAKRDTKKASHENAFDKNDQLSQIADRIKHLDSIANQIGDRAKGKTKGRLGVDMLD